MSDERLVEQTLDDDFAFEDEHEENGHEEDGRAQAPGAAHGGSDEADSVAGGEAEQLPGEPGSAEREDETSQPLVIERGRQAQVRSRETAQEKIRRLVNDTNQLRQKLEALERGDGAAQQQRLAEQQRQQAEQEVAAERQALESMDPVAISRFYAQRTERMVQRETQLTRYQVFDQNDQENFNRMLAANPRIRAYYERNKPEFERLRGIAPGATRRQVLQQIIGEYTLDNFERQRTRQDTRAANGAARLTTTPPNTGRSNVASERGTATGQRARRGWEHMRDVRI